MNPHHHLHESTLMSYAAGALPAPLSIVAGAHLEQCPHCRQRLRDAEAIGSVLLEQTQPPAAETRREQLREAMLMQLATEAPVPMAGVARPVPKERPEANRTICLHRCIRTSAPRSATCAGAGWRRACTASVQSRCLR